MKNDTATRQTIAQTILRQLGAGRFTAMTGAKNFVALESGLAFRLPSNFATKGINQVTITLTPADTYTMTFRKIRGVKVVEIAEVADVYCDQLQQIFTDETGLHTRL